MIGRLRPSLEVASANVRTVLRNFVPVFVGRGVVQISAYVDTLLASLLPTGAVTALMNAQTLYTLPVSLFGMSVSAAELPTMSSARGDESTIAAYLRTRLDGGLRRIAFFVVPSAVAFVALGDILAVGAVPDRALHQRRRDLRVGHPRRLGRRAAGIDARPPLLVDVLRAARHADAAALRARARGADDRARLVLRAVAATHARRATSAGAPLGSPRPRASRAGSSSSCCAPPCAGGSAARDLAPSYLARLWLVAAVAAAATLAMQHLLQVSQPIVRAAVASGVFGAVYLLGTAALGVDESRALVSRVVARRR